MEPEFYSMAPSGVSIHTARMMLHDVTPESLESMAGDAFDAVKDKAGDVVESVKDKFDGDDDDSAQGDG